MGYYSDIHLQMQEDGELEEEQEHPTPDQIPEVKIINGEMYDEQIQTFIPRF